MNSIIKKELKKIFNSLEGYILAIVFLLTNGLALWVLPYPAPNIFEGGFASLDEFFKLNSLILLFLTPVITMGMIAEERKTNTLEFDVVATAIFSVFAPPLVASFGSAILKFP